MDDVDILYVIGNGSANNNVELKYSLRTVSRHCKGVGRVVISGEMPSFVGGRVETVSCTDISVSGKHWNMLHKIAEGIRRGGLVKPFLFSSDDHFFTRDFRMPLWARRLRRERIYTEAEYEAENVLHSEEVLICDIEGEFGHDRAFYRHDALYIEPVDINYTIDKQACVIEITAKEKYVHAVAITGNAVFEANCFSLMPYESRTISYRALNECAGESLLVEAYTLS